MAAPPAGKGEPINDYRDLVGYLERGSKSRDDWRIGTEHEKFAYDKATLKPLEYEGRAGIRALLEGLSEGFGWQAVLEDGKPIALTSGHANISLEPGGQFELSGAPVATIHQTCSEVHQHLAQVREIADPLGVGMLGMGFQPKWSREETPWMPKGRYQIMGRYMPTRGSLGLDMMLRTCTIQTNLDYENEADMVQKFRVSLALQPIATALFANSPFSEGKPNGFASYRSHIWTDTDPDRCGILPFVFEEGMGFERYVDYALDVPMYFVYHEGRYLDASGQSFRDFLKGELPAHPGQMPTINDWSDHLTTIFPEVRLKRFLEMRGADGGPWRQLCALPALWVGLLYDASSQNAAWDLCKDWTVDDHTYLRAEVPKKALKTQFRVRSLRDLAMEVLMIAEQGLKNRARPDWDGVDESKYLSALWKTAESGKTPADEKLERFEKEWGGMIDPVFAGYAY